MPTIGTSNTGARRGTVHIYIDNPNLWIQGQKTYAEKKGLDVSWDPTWRFDVGKLRAILTRQSTVAAQDELDLDVKVNLYGSTPPPVDTVWEALKSQNVKVTTFARSTWTGREKQVDSELGLDSALQAAEDKHMGISSEFVIVSGDRELYSAVIKILERGFPVHVWSWRNGLANVYNQRQADEERIGFRESTFRVDRDAINPHSTVVLDPLPKADEVDEFLSRLSVPAYRYVCPTTRPNVSSPDLVIVPAFAGAMAHGDLEQLHRANKTKLEACGLIVLTYFEYCQKYLQKSAKDELSISQRFKEVNPPEDDFSSQPRNPECHADNNSNGSNRGWRDVQPANADTLGFTTVNHRSQQQKRKFQQKESKSKKNCIWGRYCKDPESCSFGHTPAHKAAAKAYGRKMPRKFKMCHNLDTCSKGSLCQYAHAENELLCPTCDKVGVGHSLGQCLKAHERSSSDGHKWS